jgi:hypothetical protein
MICIENRFTLDYAIPEIHGIHGMTEIHGIHVNHGIKKDAARL